MAIDQADFDAIKEQDIDALVDAQVPEGLRLEFKLTQYGKSDSDKRELLKDVSALANSHGGHILLGIKEAGGVATRVVGTDVDADAEILRMEQIARNGIEPPISGVRIKAISLASGKKVLLLRIPRSWNPPHRVAAQGLNRFYIRHSAGVHEPSIEELRALFNQSASALEQARRFRDERIQSAISGKGQRPLEAEGRFFLHIIPVAAFSGMVHLDVEKIHDNYKAFCPIGVTEMNPGFNYHGFINERGGDKNYGYTQIFRNGALEATIAEILRNDPKMGLFILGLGLEKMIFKRFSSYITGLRDIGVPPPLIIMITFEGVYGVRYSVKDADIMDFNYYQQSPLPEAILKLPECVLEEYGTETDHHRAVRPAFDGLWNAIGYPRSEFFDANDLWVGKVKVSGRNVR